MDRTARTVLMESVAIILVSEPVHSAHCTPRCSKSLFVFDYLKPAQSLPNSIAHVNMLVPVYDPKYPDPAKHGYKGPLQCGVFKPTNVISVSYGGWEAGFPIAYQSEPTLSQVPAMKFTNRCLLRASM